jgi:site-specific DNA-cytosine methylase
MEKVFKNQPQYVISFDGFQNNDQHYINHLRKNGWKGQYITVDNCSNKTIPDTVNYSQISSMSEVDVVGCVAPCAGLSSLSTTSKADSPVNDWMYKCSKFVLDKVKPKIFWGENSIFLASNKGRPVADNLAKIGREYGYTFLIYATENKLHGNPQKRPRTFYFYFRNDTFKGKCPILDSLPYEYLSVEDLLSKVENRPNDPMNIPINNLSSPADHPFYQYLYEHYQAKNHRDLVLKIAPTTLNKTNTPSIIGQTVFMNEKNLDGLSDWFFQRGYEKWGKRVLAIKEKFAMGKGAWLRGPQIDRGFIPAFVGDQVMFFIHPYECRYLTFREALSVMAMPQDFELIGNIYSNRNHIAQNVCMSTSMAMSKEIEKILNGTNKTTLDIDNEYLIQDHRKKDQISKIKF